MAVRFLRRLDVSAVRIACAFSDTPDNIRHIDNRAYLSQAKSYIAPDAPTKDDLRLVKLSQKQREQQARLNLQGLRIRTKDDLAHTESIVWQIFRSHLSIGFEQAYEALHAMLSGVANARYGQALRVKLLIHEKLAWFAMPLGRLQTALRHSRIAMKCSIEALRESAGNKEYLLRYGESGLVASLCLQKLHVPEEAFKLIRLADEANRAAGHLPGSEHLRQYGSILIQLGARYDDQAEKFLLQAPVRMEKKNEARNSVDLLMQGLRHKTYLEPDSGLEDALQLVGQVDKQYGSVSMQHAVAAKSAAAVALKLGDPKNNEIAINLLEGGDSVTYEPGTLTQILSITPFLNLKGPKLDRWLRFAMQETPKTRR